MRVQNLFDIELTKGPSSTATMTCAAFKVCVGGEGDEEVMQL